MNLAIITINTVGVYETSGLILLPSGKAYAIGGTGQTAIFTPGPTPTDPGSWTQGPTFPKDNSASPNWPTLTALDAPACLLPSGKVVCLAGTAALDSFGFYFSFNPVFLEYDPNSSATTLPSLDAQPTLPSGNQTWQSLFLLLPTGQLLCTAQTNTIFLYTPDPASGSPDASWKPANISVPGTLVLGHSYTLSGTQINGLSQAVSYGDDAGMATNYPIVQLTNPVSGRVAYLHSANFSTMGVATGVKVPDDLQSCTIDIRSDLATGTWNLVVIANGITSDPVPVQIAAQDCFLIVDNSTFSVGEIDTFVKASPPVNAVFDPAFYVVVEGYTPAEIGIDTTKPIPPQLANPPILPAVPSPFPGHVKIAFSPNMIPEDPTLPPTPQRFTFPFSMEFLDDTMFGISASIATLNATFSAAGNMVANSADHTDPESQPLHPAWRPDSHSSGAMVSEPGSEGLSSSGKLAREVWGDTRNLRQRRIHSHGFHPGRGDESAQQLRLHPRQSLTDWRRMRTPRYCSYFPTIPIPETRRITLRSPGCVCAIPAPPAMCACFFVFGGRNRPMQRTTTRRMPAAPTRRASPSQCSACKAMRSSPFRFSPRRARPPASNSTCNKTTLTATTLSPAPVRRIFSSAAGWTSINQPTCAIRNASMA